jgi:4-amino-4-deoxy-L-arabinose transferase-like glycosyltransferase
MPEPIRRPPPGPDIAILLTATLAVRVLSAWLLHTPGYMDAYYYYVGAARIAAGFGLTEPYIWNYLSEPLTLPMPAFGYWMPLTSFIVAPFLAIFGASFRAAQIPMILLSSLLPLLAYGVSVSLAPNRRRALIAGLLVALSPFYVKFMITTSSAVPFAVTACLALLIGSRAIRDGRPTWYAFAGALIGVSHLARADAPLLFGALALAALWPGETDTPWRERLRPALSGLLLAALAYLMVAAPWLWRNLHTIGSPLGGAGFQSAFLRDYDDLYSYGRAIDLASFLEWGWPAILQSRLDAAGANLLTVIGVFLSFFLAPFAALEMWARRRQTLTRAAFWYLLALYLTMTLVFPLPGQRGSLLHSGAALLPLLIPFAVAGLDRAIEWIAARREGWDAPQASRVFGAGLVALSFPMAALLYAGTLIGSPDGAFSWNTQYAEYAEIGAWLDTQGEPADAPVMVVDPPAFSYHTGRYAAAIPNEPPAVIADVCRRFGVTYLILERNHPDPLDALYDGTGTSDVLTPAVDGPADLEARLYRCQTTADD